MLIPPFRIMYRHIMKSARFALLVALAPVLAAGQQTPSSPPASPAATPTPAVSLPIEFSGLLFPQLIYGGAKGNRSANQFQLERAYLTAKAKIADRTSIRLTADVYRPGGTGGYTMRAKYAFVQYDYWTKGEGYRGMNGQVRLGMQQTVINETEEAFWPRYIAKIATERAGYFAAADLGASTTLDFASGVAELFVMVANGPGYTSAENDRFKDYSARLTLTPLGGTAAQGLTIAPWYYKGAAASVLRPAEGRTRDRAGIFAGFKAPTIMIGGDVATATNENERVVPAGIVTEDRSGKILSLYTHLRPLAMMSPLGSKAWGVILRWDNVTGDAGYLPTSGDFPVVEGKFIVAGLTHDVNNRLSWSLDFQQQSPNGAPAPTLDQRTYNLHVSAAF